MTFINKNDEMQHVAGAVSKAVAEPVIKTQDKDKIRKALNKW